MADDSMTFWGRIIRTAGERGFSAEPDGTVLGS